ncbi:MAG: hypothetical protein JNM66_07115 [Bryobacterales bacterium]|nr:hypothetical protein [Bryobacterales bacterium]
MNVEQIFYGITTTVTLVLAILTLQRLLSGWWRQYYLLALILVLLLVGVVPPIASYVSNGNWTLSSAQKIYWALALASQFAVFLLVLQLIYRVGREMPTRARLLRMLTLGAFVVAGLSVLLHFEKRPNAFMTSVTRDLTFLTAIMNLILWRFLMQLRKRNFLLLAVSAGLGIQCTGDAIGHSFRMLARQAGSVGAIHDLGNILMSLASVITIAIWHTAFSRTRHKSENTAPAAPAVDSVPVVTARNSHPELR